MASAINNDFFNNLDEESISKQAFTSYYFAVYLKMIESIKHKYGINSRVVYLDFFAGPGLNDNGLELTPLKVVEAFSKQPSILNNCFLYFNDLYESESLSLNLKNKIGELGIDINYIVDNKDAKTINVEKLYKQSDIVLSFVDSFGFMMADVDLIKTLTNNRYSDCLVFINLKRICRFIEAENEKKNFIAFFGSEKNYYRFRRLFNTETRDSFLNEVVENYCQRLSWKNSKLQFLPVFFKLGDESTLYSHVVIVVSKSALGINMIREAFTEVDEKENNEGLKNEHFYLVDEKIVVFKNNNRGTISLFGDEKEKYYKVLEYISDNPEEMMNLDELMTWIDIVHDKRNHFLSGYSKKFLRRALKVLEDENKIIIAQREDKKRTRQTYGEGTYFYKNENNN